MILLAGVLNWILGMIFLVVMVYSLYELFTGDEPKNMSKLLWAVLIIFIPFLGVIFYWITEKDILN